MCRRSRRVISSFIPTLRGWLRRGQGLPSRVDVVLAACDGGHTGDPGNHLGSVAQALHRAGIQSVVVYCLGWPATGLRSGRGEAWPGGPHEEARTPTLHPRAEVQDPARAPHRSQLTRWRERYGKVNEHNGKIPRDHWILETERQAILDLAGTFYYLCSVLDGYSRSIIHRDIREAMTERDVECILQRARELHPDARPRIATDNGPQFIARDFKDFIRIAGMTHVRISPGYPQSNGKIERWHKTFMSTALRPAVPSTIDEARRVTAGFVEHYNARRLHSAIGYVTPSDKLAGREAAIFAERDRKLEAARELRRQRRELARRRQTHHHPTETSPPASP